MTGTYLSDAFATHKVEAMVKLFGLDPLDAEQWDFLQSETTQDLQAAPGSGKTTLIGLKLALMADAWTSATCGVCVLSHTNTAKKEIADRVASLAAGRSLLRYPHFIGTIQSFVHTFLALPAVRAKGVEVRSVDDAAFETAAIRLLQHSNYSALRSYVERQRDGSGIVTGATFAYKGGELVVTGATREPPSALRQTVASSFPASSGLWPVEASFATWTCTPSPSSTSPSTPASFRPSARASRSFSLMRCRTPVLPSTNCWTSSSPRRPLWCSG